jgi:hypothetical protein
MGASASALVLARAVDTGLAFQDDCVEALNHFERRLGRGGLREDAEPAAQIQLIATRAWAGLPSRRCDRRQGDQGPGLAEVFEEPTSWQGRPPPRFAPDQFVFSFIPHLCNASASPKEPVQPL